VVQCWDACPEQRPPAHKVTTTPHAWLRTHAIVLYCCKSTGRLRAAVLLAEQIGLNDVHAMAAALAICRDNRQCSDHSNALLADVNPDIALA